MFWNFWKNRRVNRERILAFDLLRGTFLLVIITTHIAWSPSYFYLIGGGGMLPASAAEGFFAISGILVGYLYSGKILKETKKVFKKIWKRAALLWALATFFTFFYTAWAVLDPTNPKYDTIYSQGGLKFLYNTLSLRYAFGWADFLTRYAMFMLVAPFVVWLIAKGKTWIVAIASFAVWYFLRETPMFLPFSSFQLVFMFGIILGHYLPQIEVWFYDIKKQTQRRLFRGVVMAAFWTYAFSIIIFIVSPSLPAPQPILDLHGYLLQFLDKDTLAPARVAIGTLWFFALYMLFRRYEKEISQNTHGVLEVLGRQSLFVYCLHAFVLFTIDMYLRPPDQSNKILNTIVTAAVLILIYVLTYYRGHITKYGKELLKKRSTTQVP